jgi:hypothetical protein
MEKLESFQIFSDDSGSTINARRMKVVLRGQLGGMTI